MLIKLQEGEKALLWLLVCMYIKETRKEGRKSTVGKRWVTGEKGLHWVLIIRQTGEKALFRGVGILAYNRNKKRGKHTVGKRYVTGEKRLH